MISRYLIFIALLVVWLDLVVVGWWPIWFYPIWLWVGIYLSVQVKNMNVRWYWILSIGVWSMFVVAPFVIFMQTVIYLLGGEIYNYIYHRYLPVKSIILPALVGLIILLFCQVLTILATGQNLSWLILPRVAITIILSILIGIYYGASWTKKKNKYI